jgi:hypothetical protein
MAQEVNKTAINAFSRGMDTDTKDAVFPQDAYRYAENIKNEDGAVTKIRGSETWIGLENFSAGMELYLLGKEQARLFIQDLSKTTDCMVLFYFVVVGGAGTFKVQVVPLDTTYPPYVAFSESVPSDDFDAYSKTTVDIEKIGQSGYDIIYFVDNVRQPRKLELVLKSFILDYVDISLVSVTERSGSPGAYDVVVRLNVKNAFSGGSTVNAQKAFTAYIRSYRPSLGTSHPSFNSGTDRLKSVSFNVGESTKTATFAIFPQDLDTWEFNLFYYKSGNTVFSDFLIADPESVRTPVGVLPDSNLIKVRSAQNGSGASTQQESWDFLVSGPVFNYYVDSIPIVVGTTKIYKSNVDDPSNYVANGFHQDWRVGTQNNYIQVASGVITGYGVNNGDVVVTAEPSGFQADVDAAYTTANFNRLSTVSITLPATISGETFKRVEIGNNLVLNNNAFSYVLTTRDQLEITAVYVDDVILRIDTVEQYDNITSLTVERRRRFSISLESPNDKSLDLGFTQEASASYTEPEAFASAYSERIGGLIATASPSPGFPVDTSTPDTATVASGNEAIFEVEAVTQRTDFDQSAAARGEVIFTSVATEDALTITKFRVNGTLYDYTLAGLNSTLNSFTINKVQA